MESQERVWLADEELGSRIEAMAADIVELCGEAAPVLVGIREGGDVLADRLAAQLRARGLAIQAVGALDITLYRDDFGHRRHWPAVRASELPVSIEERTVVLVDDVLFTGRTVRAALNALLDYGRPERVFLAVLVDRGHRQLPVQPDVVGVELDVPRDALCEVHFREQGGDADEVRVRPAP